MAMASSESSMENKQQHAGQRDSGRERERGALVSTGWSDRINTRHIDERSHPVLSNGQDGEGHTGHGDGAEVCQGCRDTEVCCAGGTLDSPRGGTQGASRDSVTARDHLPPARTKIPAMGPSTAARTGRVRAKVWKRAPRSISHAALETREGGSLLDGPRAVDGRMGCAGSISCHRFGASSMRSWGEKVMEMPRRRWDVSQLRKH